jgi:hypothetical protein
MLPPLNGPARGTRHDGFARLYRMAGIAIAAAAIVSCAAREPAPTAEPKPPSVPVVIRVQQWVSNGLQKIFPKKKRPPKARDPRLFGEIRQINEENRFVLLDASNVTARVTGGEHLVCIADKTQKAVLRVSPLRSGTFFIADIVSGTPSVGDRVYKISDP